MVMYLHVFVCQRESGSACRAVCLSSRVILHPPCQLQLIMRLDSGREVSSTPPWGQRAQQCASASRRTYSRQNKALPNNRYICQTGFCLCALTPSFCPVWAAYWRIHWGWSDRRDTEVQLCQDWILGMQTRCRFWARPKRHLGERQSSKSFERWASLPTCGSWRHTRETWQGPQSWERISWQAPWW